MLISPLAQRVKNGRLPVGEAPAVVFPMICPGYETMRTLGRRGVPVIGVNPGPSKYFASRYCRQAFIVPDIQQGTEAFIAGLEEVGRRIGRRAVLYMHEDVFVYLASRYRQRLEPYFDYPYVSDAVLRACLNKRDMFVCAARAGVPLPRTWYPEGAADVAAHAAEWPYPSLVKPLVARFSFDEDVVDHVYTFPARFGGKALLADSPEALLRAYAEVSSVGIRTCIQEWIPGHCDQLYHVMVLAWDGIVYNHVTSRKLRQQPQDLGTATLCESVDAPETVEHARRLVRELRYRGIGFVEFKYDQRDRTYRLMEINARPVYGHGITNACGVPMVYLLHRLLLGESLPPVRQRPGHYQWWDVYTDYELYFRRYRAERHPELAMSWWAWLHSVRLPVRLAGWSWDDPWPALRRCILRVAGWPRRLARRRGWFGGRARMSAVGEQT